ncbi:hypothetical protein [Nitrospirillum viridazoti]|uniref:Uncharacterized protein n=1 Tax=Nitrospirillum amazonense TaxID=28077 RepID=A0A560HNU3_9PROT|nr:hypothetical protein [Nitrospirillum amazonense]TWB48228.1 hypothetical protein FBZ92_13012 [Nitrospirillum amazonense]
MKNPPRSALSSLARRQLSIAFEPNRLQGLTPSARSKVVERLAALLMEAAGAAEENDDDER